METIAGQRNRYCCERMSKMASPAFSRDCHGESTTGCYSNLQVKVNPLQSISLTDVSVNEKSSISVMSRLIQQVVLALMHPRRQGFHKRYIQHSQQRTLLLKQYTFPNGRPLLTPQRVLLTLCVLIACSGVAGAQSTKWRPQDNICEPKSDNTHSITCTGENLNHVPQNLPPNITRLLLGNGVMTVLAARSFHRYTSLNHLELRNFTRLKTIQAGAFDGLDELRILIIIDCISLERIGSGVFGVFKNLDTLHITKSALSTVPDLSSFGTKSKSHNNAMYEIDLSSNKITAVSSRAFRKIKTHILRLENNLLTRIEDNAFSGALIQRMICKNNFQLAYIGDMAFNDIQDLEFLDLSRSKISHLPTEGLVNIQELVLEDTYTLKQFPSVFKFSQINTARLTYEHHCCAFRHSDKQDPVASSHLTGRSSFCTTQMNHVTGQPDLPQLMDTTFDFRVKRSSVGMVMSSIHSLMSLGWGPNDQADILGHAGGSPRSSGGASERLHGKEFESNNGWFTQPASESNVHDQFSHIVATSATTTMGRNRDPFLNFVHESTVSTTARTGSAIPTNVWHETRSAGNEIKWVGCGNYSSPKDYSGVSCSPQPNAFNPCEDVMGYEWLRVFVWLVMLAALCGNLIVIIVLLTARSKLTVPKFLMCNLSFADFLMGLYLLLIASVDVHSLGEYFTFAVSWQNDGGCQVAGFLTVFSSELSVFVLTVITMERWYAISQAIHVNKRLRMRQATGLIFVGWIFASALAILPLFGVSGYGAVSICLPMETKDILDTAYILALLVFNGVAFVIICGCYVSMFLKVRASENMARSNDATIAKRMAILVLTNFICWAPIAFFGFTASFGLPLIDITNSKILLVFFYPFNSCANPFLYAILTKQFRKDFFILLGRYGFCTDKANKYKGTTMTRSYSNSRHNGLQLNVTHNHASDISILSQYRKNSSRGSSVSQNGTPPQSSRGSCPKATPQTTPQETPTSPKVVTSPSKEGPARPLFFTNSADSKTSKNERKLSTVIETSHTTEGPTDDGGACAVITTTTTTTTNPSDERVLEARDSLRDLFEGNPHGRVRSASEYVVIFKASSSGQAQLDPQSRRGSKRSNPFERQTSRDTMLSSNTLSSFMSDTSSSRFDSDSDARSMDRRLSPASFLVPSNLEKRDSGASDLFQDGAYVKCRSRVSKYKDKPSILESETLLNKSDIAASERRTADNSERISKYKDRSNRLSVDSIDEEEIEDTSAVNSEKVSDKTFTTCSQKPAISLHEDVEDDATDGDDMDDDAKAHQSLLF